MFEILDIAGNLGWSIPDRDNDFNFTVVKQLAPVKYIADNEMKKSPEMEAGLCYEWIRRYGYFRSSKQSAT